VVCYGEQEYERDLVRCRRELLEREIEGRFASGTELAHKLGLSRATVSAFFSGRRSVSLPTVVRILREIRVSFEDVHREVGREQGSRGVRSP
jgi:transcriptional regulator with XRE-family HTH domain